jgi:DNA mismatch endonuclease (patch repair protein)
MDRIAVETRSKNMTRIKSKNTVPELAVRRLLSKLNVRYRLHRSDLPGKPDIAIGRIKAAIFVHGCFWHRHPNCRRSFTPATNVLFWEKKFNANRYRDMKAILELDRIGWKAVVIWECQTKKIPELINVLDPLVMTYKELKSGRQ